jgi:hypothetical protein
MPKLSKVQFAELVRSMPGASEDDILAEARRRESEAPAEEPSMLKKAWDWANTPLTDAPSRLASKEADFIDQRSLNESPTAARLKGFVAGAEQGAGNLVSGLSSPLNLALTALSGGASAAGSRGMLGISRAARAAEAALNAPIAAEGAYNTVQGIREGNVVKAGMGVAQAAGGAAGMRSALTHVPASPSTTSRIPASVASESGAASPSLKGITPEQLAQMAADMHNAEGGSTHSLTHGPISGKPVYSVSTFPGRELKVPGKTITPQQVLEYVQQHRDVLDQPDANFGTWFNPEDNHTYLDVSKTVGDLDEALRLGQEHSQKAIYDHGQFKVIDVPEQGLTQSAPKVTPMAGEVPPEFHAVEPQTADPAKGLQPAAGSEERIPVGSKAQLEFGQQKSKLDAFRKQAAAERGETPLPRTAAEAAPAEAPTESMGPAPETIEGRVAELRELGYSDNEIDKALKSPRYKKLYEDFKQRGGTLGAVTAAVAPTNDAVVDPVLDFFGIEDDETRNAIKLGLHAMQLGAAGAVGAAAYRDIKSPITLANALATGRLATGKSQTYVAKLLRRAIPGIEDKQILRAIKFGEKKAVALGEATSGKIADTAAQKELVLQGAQNKNWYREGPKLIEALKDEGHITTPEEQRVWEGLIGSFGSQNPPKGNFRDAWQIFQAYKNGEVNLNPDGTINLPFGWSADTPGVDNATRVLGGDEPGGRKINTYTHQLAGRRLNKAVLDRHEGRAHGFPETSRPGLGDVDNSAYEVMEQTKKQVAKELGWNTDQVQAASWAGSRESQLAKKVVENPASWKKPQQGYPMLQQYRLLQAEDKLIDQGLLVRKEKSMNPGKAERAKNPDAIETKVEFTPQGRKVFEPAIKSLYDLTRENGGASVNLKTGAFTDQPFSAVSMFPERTLTIPKSVKLSPGQIKAFVMDNLDLLENENLSLGSWVNPRTGETVLDVVATVSNEGDNHLGRHLGQKYGQEAIFDFSTKSEIATGGKGRGTGDEPHLYDRLKDVSTENLRRLLAEREGASPQPQSTPAEVKKPASKAAPATKRVAAKPPKATPQVSLTSGVRYLPIRK